MNDYYKHIFMLIKTLIAFVRKLNRNFLRSLKLKIVTNKGNKFFIYYT